MDNSKDISVIIVNYNNIDLLDQCLFTLIEYTKGLEYEIIVVDNNSTDGNIDDILKKYNQIKLIKNKQNIGFAKANNLAIKQAKGKYILLLNNDTYFLENSIKKVLDFARSQNTACLVGCGLLNEDNSIQNSVYSFPSATNIFTSNMFLYKLFPGSKKLNKSFSMNNTVSQPLVVDVVIGAFMLIPRYIFVELEGFDERFEFYHEDTDLCYRFKKKYGNVIYFQKTEVVHLGGGTTKKYLWFHYKNRSISIIKFMQKHFTGTKFAIGILSHYIGILIRIPILMIAGIFLPRKAFIQRAIYYIVLLFIYPKNIFKQSNGKVLTSLL
ncbi:MAG: glycosyltransferase family 2 protein [Ignavibacteria bacterium]|nr:glycosyltransferase family 2 protein [Ignavibacteria bacterium]